VQDGEKNGGAAVFVCDAPSVTEVTVMPAAISAAWRFPTQFAALVTVTGNAAKTVTWTVTGAAAEGTGINGSGLLTVSESEPVGRSLTVTATSTVDGTKSGTSAVTAVAWAAPPDTLVGTRWKWDGSEWDRTLIFDTASHLYFDNYSNQPNGAVYDDYYTYDSTLGTGTITGGYPAGDFMLLDENRIMYFTNYKNYGHGAQFRRIEDVPSGG
jgi:hypothetical protein